MGIDGNGDRKRGLGYCFGGGGTEWSVFLRAGIESL